MRLFYCILTLLVVALMATIIAVVQVSTERDQARSEAARCESELFNVKKQNLTLDQIMIGAKIFIDHQMDENEKLKNLLEQCDCER